MFVKGKERMVVIEDDLRRQELQAHSLLHLRRQGKDQNSVRGCFPCR